VPKSYVGEKTVSLTSLAMREMQIKTILRFHFAPVGMAIIKKKKKKIVGRQWLTLVTLATQEAGNRRIVVRSQPQANSFQDTILKKKKITHTHTKKGWWSGSR
jgi:hypothetical protein